MAQSCRSLLDEENVGIGVQRREPIRIFLPHLFEGHLRQVETPHVVETGGQLRREVGGFWKAPPQGGVKVLGALIALWKGQTNRRKVAAGQSMVGSNYRRPPHQVKKRLFTLPKSFFVSVPVEFQDFFI